jgi:hypothetical protein
MSTLAKAVNQTRTRQYQTAKVAIAGAIAKQQWNRLKTYTNIYGVRMVQIDGLVGWCVTRDEAVKMFREYQQTGKISI